MIRRSLALGLILWVLAGVQAAAEAVRIVVISDLNGSYGSTDYSANVHRAVSAIIALSPDLVVSTGDMVAGQRQPLLSETEVRAMWAAFHAAVTDPLTAAGIPMAVTPGNHDASGYKGFEQERRLYAEQWKDRRPEVSFVEDDNYPFFYAFDIGPARLVSLDATTIGRLDSAQMVALATVFEDAGPARIVFSHMPLWPFTEGRETHIIGDPDLETLLEQIDVGLHLSGHHHAFYPGHLDRLSVIAQAELGGGSRRLIGAERPGPKTITLLDIEADGTIRVSALQAPDFRTPVDVRTLPESLNTPERVIYRIDTVPSGAVEMVK
ncbi:metallophosphoesterase [uncultured Shimia sp.]|uniref:metallophosphoesterase family protein n=1 Tax=uncultured Shimia sp. TaxID=573152 RepID=UPI002631D7B2|nr:metallophosphoesterase [uncultured Shimia sp.]